jgi:translocation and assembly module TamA
MRLGALFGIDPQQLAPSRRFYEGGGGTIRGFGYQQVGPKAPDGSPLGGASSADMSLEARYRFGNFGVVTFVDGGQVYETATPRLSDFRYGVGVGARYYTNFGPIRFDIATPVSRRPGESVIGVYISIGQAF